MLTINNKDSLALCLRLGLAEVKKTHPTVDFNIVQQSLQETLEDRFVCPDILFLPNLTDYTDFSTVCENVVYFQMTDTLIAQYVLDSILDVAGEIFDFEEIRTPVQLVKEDELDLDIIIETDNIAEMLQASLIELEKKTALKKCVARNQASRSITI